jgi:transcriptional regulator with XRE-family HTH domain
MYFTKNLSHLIENSQWKNISLAKHLNLSPQQIGRYISGANQPKMEILVQLGELFDVAIDDLILVDLSKTTGRKFGEGAADRGEDEDKQIRELNKLLRQRVAQVEQALKESDPDLAAELGIE